MLSETDRRGGSINSSARARIERARERERERERDKEREREREREREKEKEKERWGEQGADRQSSTTTKSALAGMKPSRKALRQPQL
jgi:hypothetical protein